MNGDFDVEDRHSGGREKVFEDAELEALLEQDSCQFDQRILDSKTSPHRLKDPMICEIANVKSRAKRMLRGRLNLSRSKENVGILSVIRSVTMHSIAAVYELSRDCNLIPTT